MRLVTLLLSMPAFLIGCIIQTGSENTAGITGEADKKNDTDAEVNFKSSDATEVVDEFKAIKGEITRDGS